jgi:hypothetical protein
MRLLCGVLLVIGTIAAAWLAWGLFLLIASAVLGWGPHD